MSMSQRFFRESQRLILSGLFFAFLMMAIRLFFVLLRHKFWTFSLPELWAIIYYGSWIDWRYLHVPVVSFFILVTLPALLPFTTNRFIHRLSIAVVGLWALFFVLVGGIRAIYYGYFRSSFNQFIFQARTEDPWLILATVNHDYPLWIIVPAILMISLFLFWVWHYLDRDAFIYWPGAYYGKTSAGLSALCLLVPVFFYGNMVYARESEKPTFTWETIDILPVSPFAREAILNDFESFARAQELYKTYWRDGIEDMPPEMLREQFIRLQPRLSQNGEIYNNIELYARREARGALIEKPSHVFIIIGEAYSQWPLLDKYSAYHLADGMKSLIAERETAWVKPFVANSTYTSAALIPIISGLTGVRTSPLHEPESYRSLYSTSLAPQMTKLGYQSHFWYGGPGNWEQVRPFVLAQGFTNFHGVGDPGMPTAEKLSYWGVPDKYLFDSILATLPDNQPTVNVILTTSNHAPFNIDLDKEGFPRENFRAALPPEWQKEDELINQLGHFWYADREMTRFIRETRQKHPGSLFIITGDHPDRITRKPVEGFFEWETIPFIVQGPGISQTLFPIDTVGGQINLIPTLIELIAPQGFTYYSIAPSLTEGSYRAFSSQYWITNWEMGKRSTEEAQSHPNRFGGTQKFRDTDWEEATLTYTWWRINKGKYIENP